MVSKGTLEGKLGNFRREVREVKQVSKGSLEGNLGNFRR